MNQLSELKDKENHYELNQEELKQNLFKITKKFKDEISGLNNLIQELRDEKQKILTEQVDAQAQQRKELFSENYFLKIKCSNLEKLLEEKELILTKEDTYKHKYSVLLKEYTDEKASWLKSYSEISQKYSEIQDFVKKVSNQRTELRKEIKELTDGKQALESELAELKSQNLSLRDELEELKISKSISEEVQRCSELVKQKCEEGEAQLESIKRENQEFSSSIEEKISVKISEISENQKNLKTTVENLTREREIGMLLQKELNEANGKLMEVKVEGQELRGHISTLEQLLYVKNDVGSEFEKCKAALGNRNEDFAALREQVSGCVKVADEQRERIFELENEVLKCRRVIDTKNEVSHLL